MGRSSKGPAAARAAGLAASLLLALPLAAPEATAAMQEIGSRRCPSSYPSG